MSESYSNYVVEWHGGKTRAYVAGWVQSETDKTATIYISGCANAYQIAQYGVRVTLFINGVQVATNVDCIMSATGSANVAWCEATLTIEKTSTNQSITLASTITGETYQGYGPISGTASATTSVFVGAKVLRPPSAPQNLTVTRTADANISLSWESNETSAELTLIERMEKGEDFELIAQKSGALTSFTDAPGAGSFKYRVRYQNTDGYSAYSNESDYIYTLCAPAAPTLLSPASGAVVDANTKTVALKWRHNAIDSSAQTEALLFYSFDNESFSKVSIEGSLESYTLDLPENATVYWRVQTKGAHADFGPTSEVAHFHSRTAPVAILYVPSIIEALPIKVAWDYDDACGTQTSATLDIVSMDGTRVFSTSLASERACTISAHEFTPAHEETLTLTLTVVSSTSLSFITKAVTKVLYSPPATPSIAISTISRTAGNEITVFAGVGAEGTPDTVSLSLFRDGELIAKDLAPGQTHLDATPPLDTPVKYLAAAYAESGAAATRSDTVVVDSSGFAFFSFADSVAKLGMNITIKDKTENQKEYYSVASSQYQKVFYGEGTSRSGSIEADVFWKHDSFNYGKEAMLCSLEKLKNHKGLVYLRLPYSDAFWADVDVSTAKSTNTYNVASVSVDWRRVM